MANFLHICFHLAIMENIYVWELHTKLAHTYNYKLPTFCSSAIPSSFYSFSLFYCL